MAGQHLTPPYCWAASVRGWEYGGVWGLGARWFGSDGYSIPVPEGVMLLADMLLARACAPEREANT